MDDATRAELEMLRERAYGRSSDIAGDPVALRRLAELESRAAGKPEVAPEEPAPVEPEPEPEPVAEVPAAPDEAPDRLASGMPRWVKVVAPLAAVALVAITAVVTTLIVGSNAPYAGMQRVERLTVLEGAELADANLLAFATYDERFSDVLGYAVTIQNMSSDPQHGYKCLAAQTSTADDLYRSDMNSTCGAEPFPITVTIILSDRSPEEALEAYPVGTALHFALNGSSVDVYADEP